MNNKKIEYSLLFIEDEDDTRKNYVRYLQRYFENVYEARDGEEGYRIYLDKKPDILIIDINIPLLNGLDLLKKIRQKDHTTRAIMLTAHSEKHFLLEAVSLKLTNYLVKPITRDELKSALHQVIEEITQFSINSKKLLRLKDNHTWNLESKELFKEHTSVILTTKEKMILEILFNNLNQDISYDTIIVEVWDSFEKDKISSLKTLIKNVRKKLPEDTITNVYGIGYKVIL